MPSWLLGCPQRVKACTLGAPFAPTSDKQLVLPMLNRDLLRVPSRRRPGGIPRGHTSLVPHRPHTPEALPYGMS